MTSLDWMPDWFDDIWAKSPTSYQGTKPLKGESLIQHNRSVLERLSGIVKLRPDLPQDIGVPRLWHILFWACMLHDMGKAARGFQSRLRGGPPWGHRHEVLSLAFIKWIESAFVDSEIPWLAAAIVSHHKDSDEIFSLYSELVAPDENPVCQLVDGLAYDDVHRLWRWIEKYPRLWINELGLADAGISLPTLPPSEEAVSDIIENGRSHIRSYLGAYRAWLRRLKASRDQNLIIGTISLRGFLLSADHGASAHLVDLPPSALPNPNKLIAVWGLAESGLYDHQKACMLAEGNAILTAPTGSGKTEAALLWAMAQSKDGKHTPRLFYTLPFQASMNAMYDRLQNGGFNGLVSLEHSRSLLALYRRFSEEHALSEKATDAARWHKQLARLNYFPVRVLSPYQILKAPYRLPGYEQLLSDCFNAVFVFDEIHAYEPARLGTIFATLKFLKDNFGSTFFVTSATFPSMLTKYLASVLGEYVPVRASEELYAQFQRHSLNLVDGELLDSAWLHRIAKEAREGSSVLVCCNTVLHAQEAFRVLQEQLKDEVKVILLHGRFNSRDRLRKESAIMSRSGFRSRSLQPVVVVATQVVEVSLDIDLDTIYTEPAPIEALIQRFGRVNRRRRRSLARVNVFTRPNDGQHVYDSNLVQTGLAVLHKHAGQPINEGQISEWIDEVYLGDIGIRWENTYCEAYARFNLDCLNRLRAFQSDKDLQDLFYQAFDSIDVLPVNLVNEYEELSRQGRLLDAGELLVPIRWAQFSRLRKAGKVEQSRIVPVVEGEYDPELGLNLG